MALYAIGEALIDFVPNQTGRPHENMSYRPAVGGAPLNVAAAYAKLGGSSYMLTQVGADDFGAQILATAEAAGVDTRHIKQSGAAKTALAFVSLLENGERSFSFYRSPSADMLYPPEAIDAIQPSADDILHFCSVSLIDSPMREAHCKAIEKFRQAGAKISFDVNVRLPLWDDHTALRDTIWQFLPLADLVKISDDELDFVSPAASHKAAIAALFTGSVQEVLYTAGANGASWHHKSGAQAEAPRFTVQAVDATGAGDAFIGTYLAHWHTESDPAALLRLASAAGAFTTLTRGAIAGMPTAAQLHTFIHQNENPT